VSALAVETRDLTVEFAARDGGATLRAVDGVDLALYSGESVGLVGESGCGKTTLARTLLGLQRPTSGSVHVSSEDVSRLEGTALKKFRRRIQLVFQNPVGSLNPRIPVGTAIREVLDVHGLGASSERPARVADLLTDVGMAPDAADRFPHEFSGGQRQRIAIARALAVEPEILIADEPVSALDVSVQAQVLTLLRDLREKRKFTLLLISHDLAVVRYLCERVIVMFMGRVVEMGTVDVLYDRPAHPYTTALLEAVPDIESGLALRRDGHVGMAQGRSPIRTPIAEDCCRYAFRCSRAEARCLDAEPGLEELGGGRLSACYFARELASGGAPTGTAPGSRV